MSNTEKRELTMQEQLDALRAENEALKAKGKRTQTISCKVSAKGAISVYGLGKFPVTLYASQWTKVNEFMPKLLAYATEHKSELADKNAVVTEPAKA